MILVCKFAFFISFFFILSYIIEHLYYKNNKKIIEAKGEFHKQNYFLFMKFQNQLEKNKKIKSLFEKKNTQLKKMGYPMKMNAFSYYMTKVLAIVLLITFILSGIFNSSLVIAVGIILILPDLMCYSLNKKENLEIVGDLPFINDVLNIQSSAAGMDLGKSLTEVFDIARNKRFKENLIKLSIEIGLTKNIPEALDHFLENFDIPEIDSFVLTIKQSIKTGRNKELLDSQSELLKDASLARVSAKNKEISLWLGLVGGLIFLGLAGLMLFSFGSQIYDGLKDLI